MQEEQVQGPPTQQQQWSGQLVATVNPEMLGQVVPNTERSSGFIRWPSVGVDLRGPLT